MKHEIYNQLVDIYAGRELPTELESEMEAAAFTDLALSHNMATLRRTVDLLQSQPKPEFTEESYQRVLMKIYARGGNIEPKSATPTHLQYHLPIQG